MSPESRLETVIPAYEDVPISSEAAFPNDISKESNRSPPPRFGLLLPSGAALPNDIFKESNRAPLVTFGPLFPGAVLAPLTFEVSDDVESAGELVIVREFPKTLGLPTGRLVSRDSEVSNKSGLATLEVS